MNNAAWMMGEIYHQIWVKSRNFAVLQQSVEPSSERIIQKLAQMLQTERLNKSVALTVAATLGRAGLVLDQVVASVAGPVMKQWVLSLRLLKASTEKESAFR